jgi:hypothetical protein
MNLVALIKSDELEIIKSKCNRKVVAVYKIIKIEETIQNNLIKATASLWK